MIIITTTWLLCILVRRLCICECNVWKQRADDASLISLIRNNNNKFFVCAFNLVAFSDMSAL